MRFITGSLLVPALVLGVVLAAAPAAAQVDRYIGRPIADVRLTLAGQPTSEVELREVLETRANEPLQMALVRESIIHLMALARFEDVRVEAQETARGVVLTYALVPLRTVRSISFRGRLVLPEDLLRSEVVNRFGAAPPLGRADDIAHTLEDLYRDHGFASPAVKASPEREAGSDRVTLTFDVNAGDQARIARIRFEVAPPLNAAEVARRLQLKEAGPFDPSIVEQRRMAFQESLRSKGYYEANVDVTRQPTENPATTNLVVTADRGPFVSIDLKGDPVPANKRAELMPIAGEQSIDQDLLEDWSTNIVRYFESLGYRDAKAPFERHLAPDRSRLQIVFTIARGRRYILSSVQFVGNRFLDDAQLGALLNLRQGQPFVQSAIKAGVARIQARYQSQGFAAAAATPKIEASYGDGDGADVLEKLTVTISEGQQTVVASVSFVCNGRPGNCAIPEGELRKTVALQPGAPFYVPEIDRDRDKLTLAYLNRGYQLVNVEVPDPAAMMSADRKGAAVRFEIREGPQVFVDHVLVVGNNRVKTSTIRNELQVRPGQPLDLDKLEESRRRLSELGLFRRVRVSELQHGSEDKRDVLVIVEEAPATSLAWGGGVEGAKRLRQLTDAAGNPIAAVPAVELAPRLLFGIGRRNLWGKNRSVNFTTSAAVRPNATTTNLVGTGVWEYRAIGTYQEPRIFGSSDLIVTGGVEQTVRTSYSFNRRSVRGEVAHRLSAGWSVYGRYSLERTHILSEQASGNELVLIDRLLPPYLLSKVSSSVVRDSRDDPVDPSTGVLASMEVDLTPRVLGSEVGFGKALGQIFTYRKLPTTRRIVFAGGARLGLARGFSGPIPQSDGTIKVGRFVPISERFFSGNTVRGFIEDRLGTPDTLTPDGFPSGGNALLILNGELRFAVWKDLSAATFVDAGNVFGKVSEINPSEIRASLGFGLRYKSPIGPIRVDLGLNPDRRFFGGIREPLTAVYFGIGQAF